MGMNMWGDFGQTYIVWLADEDIIKLERELASEDNT
jgi:hypothetical protein